MDDLTRKSLKNVRYESRSNTIPSGIRGRFFSPFIIALGASPLLISLLASLPQLVNALVQLTSSLAFHKQLARKRTILIAVALQSLTWLVFIAIALWLRNPLLVVITGIAFSAFDGLMAPLWNSWVGDLLPLEKRNRFFGKTSRMNSFITFGIIITAGFLLSYAPEEYLFEMFAGLFTVSFVARLASFYFFTQIHDPKQEDVPQVSARAEIKGVLGTAFGKFLLFLLFFYLAIYVSAPFFAVYMLRDLGLSYLTYTLLIAVSVLANALMSLYWSRHADKLGTRTIVLITGLATPILPLLWLISTNVFYLGFIQLLGGFIWAGFNLGSVTYLFDAVPKHRRAHSTAYISVVTSIGMLVGATLGGLLVTTLPAWTPPAGVSSIYFSMFVLSAGLRLIVVLGFLRYIKKVTPPQDMHDTRQLFVQLIAVDPTRLMMGNTVKGINTGYRRIESSRQQLLNAQRATLFQSKRMLLDLHEYATQRQAKRLEKETTAAISAVSKATVSDKLLSKVALRKIERQTKSLSEGFDASYLKKKMARLEGEPRRRSLTGIEASLAKQEKAAVKATKQLVKELKK